MRKVIRWGVIAILVAVLVIGVVFILPKEDKGIIVSRIIDGDTVELSTGKIVRYIGVDTPEVSECYYQEAKEKNSELVLGKEVELVKEVSETDKYGRLLRYVLVDGENISSYLIRYGYGVAMVIAPDDDSKWAFEWEQKLAEQDGIGIWAECNIK